MTMTKKNYIAIAAAVRAEWEDESTAGKYEALDSITARLVEVLKSDNPNFDEKRFVEATQAPL